MQYYSISCEKFLNLLIIWNQQREPKHEKIEMSMRYMNSSMPVQILYSQIRTATKCKNQESITLLPHDVLKSRWHRPN